MITLNYQGQNRAFPNKMLSTVCLEIAMGGDLSEDPPSQKQLVIAAMLMDNLLNHGYVKTLFGRMTITITDDGETSKVLDHLMGSTSC